MSSMRGLSKRQYKFAKGLAKVVAKTEGLRYKPVGWRQDSQRHSLAAKGIRTSFYVKEDVASLAKSKEASRKFRKEMAEEPKFPWQLPPGKKREEAIKRLEKAESSIKPRAGRTGGISQDEVNQLREEAKARDARKRAEILIAKQQRTPNESTELYQLLSRDAKTKEEKDKVREFIKAQSDTKDIVKKDIMGKVIDAHEEINEFKDEPEGESFERKVADLDQDLENSRKNLDKDDYKELKGYSDFMKDKRKKLKDEGEIYMEEESFE